MRLETCGPDSSPRAAPRPPRAGTGGPGRRGLPILPPPSCLPPPAPRAAPSRAEPAAGGRARSDTRRLPEYAVGQRQSMQRKNAISSSALERLETGWRGGGRGRWRERKHVSGKCAGRHISRAGAAASDPRLSPE